ncbi:hypothetical protein PISMIDRAFT_106160 [Pisolithus microcarpus 441]|uniref:Tc1-like transposase DDE domain-containing protein n=1 Tax=Pisolithus microcarpus 441 TaxID=765257 RepID=A0A0C9ZCS0_9AGAM|nr:hypothetical protein PISMIDRAFT_106160 [Pisolithus microcarpus 441]
MYMNQISKEVPDANMLMFINKAAKDEHMVFRKYGHSPWGVCCVSGRWFIHGVHYSIIPVLTLDSIITYDIIEGPVDTNQIPYLFLIALQSMQMPFTNLYPGLCSVLVMDNCHIHHGDEVHCLVEEENCKSQPA